ncbi:MAG: hypothetical protein HY430_04115 [Candidatus Levybacteria bacterium]|nr:hypothetical protein [Candidatus Levybacteria bacterium]
MNFKKLAYTAAASALLFGSLAVPAFASNSGDGSDYGTQPGYEVSASHTDCQGHGSFGYFGKDWNLGNDQSGHYPGGSYPGPGADGTQTGINNSSLCGNPQN